MVISGFAEDRAPMIFQKSIIGHFFVGAGSNQNATRLPIIIR